MLPVSLGEQERRRLAVIALVRQLPAERIGQTVIDVEEKGDVECVADGFARDAKGHHLRNAFRSDVVRGVGKRLEQLERSAQPAFDGRGAIIVEDSPRSVAAQRQFRDRGMGAGSEDALVEARDEGGEELPFADAPRRWSPHDGVGELGEGAAEETFPVTQCPDDTRRMSHEGSHHGEHHAVAQAMRSMHPWQSHARASASSAAESRAREAPRAALTMSSKSWSSVYRSRSRAMSASLTVWGRS